MDFDMTTVRNTNACKGFSISCSNCNLSELCLPFSLGNDELTTLDNIIERKKPYQKGQHLVESGQSLRCLYAVRSGSFKSFLINEEGVEQITGFHLPGDIIGFDGIGSGTHHSYAQSLETSMVCEIPFDTIDSLSGSMPSLRQQVHRLMSNEISNDQSMFMLLNKKNAEQRVCTFLVSLSTRFAERGLSAEQFRLTMTRADLGNYLGLTVETVSRIFSKLQKAQLLSLNGKFVEILDFEQLQSAMK